MMNRLGRCIGSLALQCRSCKLSHRIPSQINIAQSRQSIYHHTCRGITTTQQLNMRDKDIEEVEKRQIMKEGQYFEQIAKVAKNREAFQEAVMRYKTRQGVYHRGHVEFIYAAMDKMTMFNVHKDLEVYKTIMKIFPEDKMVPTSVWQVEFQHYPKQQNCMIDILEKMEYNSVIPDDETGKIIKKIFGTKVHAFRKYQRMMYWMPKFKNANPYPVPLHLPEDESELAILALKRMAVDKENIVTVHQTEEEVESCIDDTFVASAQSTIQRALINGHPTDKPLFVEGGYKVWMREKCLNYFVLKADPVLEKYGHVEQRTDDNWFEWNMFTGEKDQSEIAEARSMHEQDEGTILAMCITGSSSKDSLISWIKLLQLSNPNLPHIPVVFAIRTPESELETIEDDPHGDLVNI
ncbi:unnamed protein product [Owenia fusiformis]|uniref:Evolutionarily conserved signaling intermediate in Toll pathway, mitochondrial n=1 Tax=Owenia fusiformis TaxID=6347 RepID=A0A8J1U738_OWEFU|nr:unnamed protein product [Owenia fusiformis]